MENRDMKQQNMLQTKDKIGGFAFTAATISILVVSLVLAFFKIENEDLKSYLSFLLPSLALILALFVTFKYFKLPFKPALQLFNFKFKKRYYFVIVLACIGTLWGLSELNSLFIKFLSRFGYEEQASTLPSLSVWSVILATMIIAMLPAILEEFLFRGLVMNGVASYSKILAIFITAALFSIYHMSPAKTAYQLVVGIIFTLICLKSGSLIPTIIIHFLNNFLIILNIYFNIFAFVESNKILFICIGLVCLVVAGVIVFLDKNVGFKMEEKKGSISNFFMYALGGILGCAAIWLAGYKLW